MAMIKVIRLKQSKKIADLELNKDYVGEIISGNAIALNNEVMGELKRPTKSKPGSKIAVRVTKINLPYKVELEELEGRYKIMEDSITKQSIDFLIKSEFLEKLKPDMIKASDMIRKAIAQSRLIILKHHADTDGYIGGIALERAIKPLVAKKNRSFWHYFKRTPSKSPYYDYMDCLKDINNASEELKEGKRPLIVIVDTGSTSEDLLSLKRVKQLGFEVIIVDHHIPTMVDGKAVVSEYSDIFINPHMNGGDSNLTAGMLGVELARQIAKVPDVEYMPAVAGITDKSQGEFLEKYLEVAKKKGYDIEHLTKLGRSIDFDAFYIGFFDSSVIEDVLMMNIEEQRKYVDIIYTKIESRKTKVIESAEKYAHITDNKNYSIIELDVWMIVDRGKYPTTGKATGIIFNHYVEKDDKPKIMLGKGQDYLTMRCNIEGFDLNKMIVELKKAKPYAQVSGGGHALAGTMRFAEVAREEVLEFVKRYLEDKHGVN